MSEGTDVLETSESCKCIICYYCYFLKVNFRFQPKVCDNCHDLMQKAMSFNDVATFSVQEDDYRIHFWSMSEDEAINLMKISDLKGKSRFLQHKKICCKHIEDE